LDASVSRTMAREMSKIDQNAALVEIQRAASLAIEAGYRDRMQGLSMPPLFQGDSYLEGAWQHGVELAEATIVQLQCPRCKAVSRTGAYCEAHQ